MKFSVEYKDILTRCHHFELYREGDRICIDVVECMHGSYEHKFAAMPRFGVVQATREDFCGFGDTVEEAMNECLDKIKGQSFDRIYESCREVFDTSIQG